MKNALIQRELSNPRYSCPTEVTEYAEFSMRIRKLKLDHVVSKNRYNLRTNCCQKWEKEIFSQNIPTISSHFAMLKTKIPKIRAVQKQIIIIQCLLINLTS